MRIGKRSIVFGAVWVLGLPLLLPLAAQSDALAVSLMWTRVYDGTANGFDAGSSVAVGPDGNIYVVGQIDVTGEEYNLLLRKYSPKGKKLWHRTYNGPANGMDVGSDVAVSSDGGVYVTGYASVTGEGTNLLLKKYSAKGEKLWHRTYNGPDNSTDTGRGVAVSADGSVYVTGKTYVAGQDSNLILRKYSANGAKVWTRFYNGAANGADAGNDVAVGPDGSIVVVGSTFVTGQDTNLLVRKYTAAGKRVWTRKYNSTANSWEYGQGVAIGSNGSIYVTGVVNVPGQITNLFLRKYSSAGKLSWHKTYNGPANARDDGNGVAIGPDGGVYVIGCTTIAGPKLILMLRKYAPTGEVLWTKKYNKPSDDAEGGFGIDVDSSGRIYVTGYTYPAGEQGNVLVQKYK